MARRPRIPSSFAVAAVVITALTPGAARATWATFGSPATLADSNQVLAKSISDGAGGIFVVWEDYRSGVGDVYAQHMDASGTPLWGANGAPVITQSAAQESPVLARDGSGGIIVAWQDARTGLYDVYAQGLDAAGAKRWATDGVPICTASGSQVLQVATEDASGGAIIGWRDLRGVDSDIYAQRVDHSGVTQWTLNGVAVCDTIGTQTDVRILGDQLGGAFLLWRDRRGGTTSDIYAQRLNASGTPQWTKNGISVSSAALDQLGPVMVSDGRYGFVAAWYDFRNGTDYNVYAQRITSAGARKWALDGVPVSSALGGQQGPVITTDGAAGAIVSWVDLRTSARPDVYAQRVDSLGAQKWLTDGVAVCATDSTQFVATIVSDGLGGAIMGWNDDRAGFREVYGQRVNSLGAVQWSPLGLKVGTGAGQRTLTTASPDGYGGCLFAWEDFRNGPNTDIYANRITSLGTGVERAPAPLAAARLLPARPNPFNPQTILSFDLVRPARVRLTLYDVQGRLVRELLQATKPAGRHDVPWDGIDARGRACASGVYFALLEADGLRRQTALTLLR